MFSAFFQSICEALESLPNEYQSSKKLLELSLPSINLDFDNPEVKMRQTCGIIAVGMEAIGIIGLGKKIRALFMP